MAANLLHITPAAHAYLLGYLQEQSDAIAVRFSVKKAGCSGYRYVTECAQAQRESDLAFDVDGLKCLMDEASQPMLANMTLDYKTMGPGVAHLVYINPNATNACGCGESFGFVGDGKEPPEEDAL